MSLVVLLLVILESRKQVATAASKFLPI
ncbi:hypothetical protein CGLO_13951 [Colletotrichum gloeosporioides Cg-14]|uniref:Uncharacterized protein n=1 Tax=Colletotrichum gloeosporioides (strain Cg-14) TaxID=1237896 RepID=T0K2M6_COLGC|nr:hypothetical protein CGLO_13951 [Colletotrichum gloeosporioides Cg-14]